MSLRCVFESKLDSLYARLAADGQRGNLRRTVHC